MNQHRNDPAKKVHQIPTALTLADSQYKEAMEELNRDDSTQPGFHWRSAINMVGPLLPGHLWSIGARPANGKTTFMLNTFDALVAGGFPTIYLTTEMKAEEMRRIWAGMKLGYDTSAVLEKRWADLPNDARKQIQDQLEWQTYEVADVGLFVDLPRLDRDHIAEALRAYALAAGYKFVIVDHIHRWQPRDPAQKTAELASAVQGLKGTAVKHGLTVLLAAQINRGLDRSALAEFLPPPLAGLQQTSALEQESNVVLMLHRQRKKDATIAMAKEVAMGQRDVTDLIEPDIMCVAVAKHRHRRNARGRVFRLRVKDSCLLEDVDSFDRVRMGLPPVDENTANEDDTIPF